MSTTPSPTPGPDRSKIDGGQSASDLLHQNLATFLAVPHRLMQINLEAVSHTFNFMNRRMKAQAALWTDIGQSSGNGAAAEAQRAFLETVTKDYTDEMAQLAGMARKNLVSVTETLASAPGPAAPVSRIS